MNNINDYADVDIEIINIDEANVALSNNTYHDPKYGDCPVYVYNNEGKYPHIHIIIKSIHKEICIRLDEAEFYNHAPHHKPFDNNDQCKEFDKWCRKINPDNPDDEETQLTNWQMLCQIWNSGPNSSKVDNSKKEKQPNYKNLRK
jgi:hypothetical protein